MLLVRTILGPSQIHGIGLFADEDIKAGTVVCVWSKDFDQSFLLDDFPEPVTRAYIQRHAYQAGLAIWCLPSDDMRFCNHSSSPNLRSSRDSIQDVAAVDIPRGTELTVDYYSFDEDAARKL